MSRPRKLHPVLASTGPAPKPLAPPPPLDLNGVVVALATARRIVVVVGAGISVSAGVPDFRSADTGLYDIIARSRSPLLSSLAEPQQLFDYK